MNALATTWAMPVYEDMIEADGDMAAHLPTLLNLVGEIASEQHRGVDVIELGVRTGQSTSAFLAAIEQWGGSLWSCDKDHSYADRLNGHPAWTFTYDDDLKVAHKAPPCDLLFIDTSHTYRHTLAELAHYVPKVRWGGRLVLHDTGPGTGVWRALGEYLHGPATRGPATITLHPGSYGLAVVRW